MIYVSVADTKACKFVKLYGLQGKWLLFTQVPDPDLLQAILDEAQTHSHLQCA